jgi:hypothetical protein
MLVCMLVCALALPAGQALAQKPRAKSPSAAKASAQKAAPVATEADGDGETSGGKDANKKVKVLTFGTMDLEGRLRTPQLLYFLNRVKSELESTSQQRRSFMKELQATGQEKGL